MDKNVISESLVTVIIPCYNAEKHIEKAVRSIMNQTYRNLEILCINDGSSDNTLKIIQTLKKEDSRIKIINNEYNIGLIRTLNKGIKCSSGTFIARMDADDISVPGRIKTQVDFLKSHDTWVCGSIATIINENDEKLYIKEFPCHSFDALKVYSCFDSPLIHPSVMGYSEVFKTNLYNDKPECHATEDYDLWCRLIQQGVKIHIIEKPLIKYRINPDGVSSTNATKQDINFLSLSEKHINKLYGYSLPLNIISIISGRNTKISHEELGIAIEIIKCFYYDNYKLMNSISKRELKVWRDLKILYIILNAIKTDKQHFISYIFFLFKNMHCLTNRTAINIISKQIFYKISR